MEKGPSIYAEYWTSPANEIKHFIEHGKQMNFEKIQDFSRSAKELALSSESETILILPIDETRIWKFSTETRYLVSINRSGKIITFFKSKTEYFMNKYNRWKNESKI